MTGAAFELLGVNARLGATPVLHDVHLRIESDRWTAIVGPNGAGKSTLLQVMAGLLAHTGDLRLDGRSMVALPARERARRVSWLGQGGAGDHGADDLTVHDVAMLGRLPHQRWLAAPSEADHAAVRRALEATQAWDWRARPFGELSGGERQRVLLARALAVESQVLLMDEPLANLDPPHQVDWMLTVRERIAQGGTVVSVLHELNAALAADRLMVMHAGRVLHHGACDERETHAALERVFDDRVEIHRVAGHWMAVPR